MTAQEIIADVMKRHRIGKADFYSHFRLPHLVEARKEAARLLKERELSNTQIGRLLKRNSTTVCFYLNERVRARKQREYGLRFLDPDAKATLLAVAKAEQVDPGIIAAQWIAERASYEASQKEAA